MEASRRGIHDSRSKKGCLSWEVRPLRLLPFPSASHWIVDVRAGAISVSEAALMMETALKPSSWKAEVSAPNNQITKQPPQPWRSVLHPQDWVWRLAHSRGSVGICRISKMSHWMHACSVTRLRPALCNPWTVARQAPLFMEFSRQEYTAPGRHFLLQAILPILPTQG